MSIPNTEQASVLPSNWPHQEQLTHIAVHAPAQAHCNAESTPTDFTASPSHNFAQQGSTPFALMHQMGYPSAAVSLQSPSPSAAVNSAFRSPSPNVLNNNNTTKLDFQSKQIMEHLDSSQLDSVKHEQIGETPTQILNNTIDWEVNRPHSAADLPLKNNNVSTSVANHPLLSPIPIQSSRLSWLAENKSLIGIAQPMPLKLEECVTTLDKPQPNLKPINSVTQSSNGSERRITLNEEETARLLLTLSQNLAGSARVTGSPSNLTTNNVTAKNELISSSSLDVTTTGQRSNSNQKSRTFFRPPGHRGSITASSDVDGLVCDICGFGCSSRFHYNSHMNTHGCHQCSICNYRSRTEGRLKKHMQDSHTEEQRREMAILQGDVSGNEPIKSDKLDQSAETENQRQRLPDSLEQIQALANKNISLGNKRQSKAAPSGGVSKPTKRSGGKPKRYTCKQCGAVASNKEDHWHHTKTHIPVEKQLSCTECNFITEYKHHLQYHMRNHFGSKPFKCSKCEYSCVNKSMLNSHMKSHTSLYQFRCMDCTYQTKYCHSLKMHTYKYNHQRVEGQVNDNELMEDCMEGMETESMKDYDIPADDIEAIERHKQSERERAQQQNELNQYQQQERQPAVSDTSTATQLALIGHQNVNAPRLNPLMMPLNNNPTASNQLQQFLLQQQRIGQVQQLIHNAANNFLPRHKCDVCEFTSASQEELLTHKINHFMYNQQQVQTNALHLYNQRLSNNQLPLQQQNNFLNLAVQLRNHPLQQQNLHVNHPIAINRNDLTQNSHNNKTDARTQNETPDVSAATTTTTSSTPRAAGENYPEEQMSGVSEQHDVSTSPSDSHKSMDVVSDSPNSTFSVSQTGSKKRKARKLDAISQRLQSKTSPDRNDDQLSPGEKVEVPISEKTSPVQPVPFKSPLNLNAGGLSNPQQITSLMAQLSGNALDPRVSSMPYTCQHCMIAFHDQALYQIHLGYHGYNSPFKCNRCGHNANSPLNFNLHLYQEKH